MLKDLCARISQCPYPGLDRNIRFKALPSSESSAYAFGWNTDHPTISASYSCSLARYNTVTGHGALKSDGTRYTGQAADSTETALTGTREKYIVDDTLAADCAARASAELAYYIALANTAELVVLPCHGLEIFDVIPLGRDRLHGPRLKHRRTLPSRLHPAGDQPLACRRTGGHRPGPRGIRRSRSGPDHLSSRRPSLRHPGL
jgi:hypothetical protein